MHTCIKKPVEKGSKLMDIYNLNRLKYTIMSTKKVFRCIPLPIIDELVWWED